MTATESPDATVTAPPQMSPAKRSALIVGAIVIVLLAIYVAAAALLSARVPRNSTVAGVEIGGLTGPEAKDVLSTGLVSVAEGSVTVAVQGVQGQVDPEAAGLKFDADATVDHLVGFTLSPVRMWQHVAGGGAVPTVSDVDRSALGDALEGMADDFAVEPVDAGIDFQGAIAKTTDAADGLELDLQAAIDVVAEHWLTGPFPVELPTTVVVPVISNDEASRALADSAYPLVEGPITVDVGESSTEQRQVQLSPVVLADSATYVADGHKLQLQLDGELLAEEIRRLVPDLEQPVVDATIEVSGGAPNVIPHVVGTELDFQTLADDVIAASLTEQREVTLSYAQVEPEFTAADAEALGVKEVVSEFSTNLTSDEVRTQNLRTGAAAVDGILLLPGETFSLLDALGPVDAEHGYGAAGVLMDGVLVDGMGGGLSQLATTLYNAAFFAGLEDVHHQPHSQYIPRYPEGREATIYGPEIDMKFRNDSDYGVLIQAWVADGQIHAAIWSTKVWDIRTETSPRRDIVRPTTVVSTREGCVPQAAGQPGFAVTVTRFFYRGDDLVKTEHATWRYQPVNAVSCQ